MNRTIALFAILACAATLAYAQSTERGEGGVVIKDTANVYAKSTGEKVKFVLARGDAVSGSPGTAAMFGGVAGGMFTFDEKDGRIRVMYFEPGSGHADTGWIDPADIKKFTFAACGVTASPIAVNNFKQKWNACFTDARDAALEKVAHQ